MWSNHPALKMNSILIMYTRSIRRFIGLSKLLEYGMNALEIFLHKMVLRLVKLILLSSLERLIKTYLISKFMLMT
jgi:hypothetical protein